APPRRSSPVSATTARRSPATTPARASIAAAEARTTSRPTMSPYQAARCRRWSSTASVKRWSSSMSVVPPSTSWASNAGVVATITDDIVDCPPRGGGDALPGVDEGDRDRGQALAAAGEPEPVGGRAGHGHRRTHRLRQRLLRLVAPLADARRLPDHLDRDVSD